MDNTAYDIAIKMIAETWMEARKMGWELLNTPRDDNHKSLRNALWCREKELNTAHEAQIKLASAMLGMPERKIRRAAFDSID